MDDGTAAAGDAPGRHITEEHVDVLIVGAGISGIGIAHHIRENFPDKSVLVVERKPGFGGTWLTHRYPGIRSDSDLYTFGFRFKPWTEDPIAAAAAIKRYLGQVIDEDGLDAHIRYGQNVERADWDSTSARWSVEVSDVNSGQTRTIHAGFLSLCVGYYDHETPHVPDFEGMEAFSGAIVHPQQWPEDLDVSGKRIVVIGSGATAATLVPELARDAAHVTMLQRSPTYFWAGPNRVRLADWARAIGVSDRVVHKWMRKLILWQLKRVQALAVRDPEKAAKQLIDGVAGELPDGFDVKTHFTPRYPPWNQRLAFVPNGDLFAAMRKGKASVVTDTTARFTPGGVQTGSGEVLEADIIVTATGFNLRVLDDLPIRVDGTKLSLPDTVSYRGLMLEGVPNLFFVFGYLRTSWTMRVELLADFVCRVMTRMQSGGHAQVTPRLRASDADMARLPWIPDSEFSAGYIARGRHMMPLQGDRDPWRFTPDYYLERTSLPEAPLDDGALMFTSPPRQRPDRDESAQ